MKEKFQGWVVSNDNSWTPLHGNLFTKYENYAKSYRNKSYNFSHVWQS
jgi:hypothetical protein